MTGMIHCWVLALGMVQSDALGLPATRMVLKSSITLSPVYPAAASLLGSERGLSMRFPRFMQRRDDKSWEQASTSEQFADMYRRQIKEAPARKSVGVATERDDDEAGRDVSEGHLAEGDLEDDVDGDAPLEQEEGEELSNERVPGDAAQ